MDDKPLILASASPRRSELMRQIGLDFRVQPAGGEERSRFPGESAGEYASALALTKAEDVARTVANGIVIGADTVVAADDAILGKPADDADALRMLTLLQGRAHQVVTGLAILHAENGVVTRQAVRAVSTDVTMRAASTDELAVYIATGEPRDKAGAYAIQGRAAVFISGLNGDYFNVVGLPLFTLMELLAAFGHPAFP